MFLANGYSIQTGSDMSERDQGIGDEALNLARRVLAGILQRRIVKQVILEASHYGDSFNFNKLVSERETLHF